MTRAQKLNVADWAAVATLGVLYLILNFQQPFHRLLFLNDESIQFPMAKHERIPDSLCTVLAVVCPAIIITVSPIFLQRRKNSIRVLLVSLLGLGLTFVLNGVVTNLIKIWLGRPRPDFVARCIPQAGTPLNEPVGIEVCTNTNMAELYEGLKSTPSGHSSTSFSGLLYLSLWLCGQMSAARQGAEVYKGLISFSPLVLATYIAISRTEDYRHHYIDVVFGSILGSFIAWICYVSGFCSRCLRFERCFQTLWLSRLESCLSRMMIFLLTKRKYFPGLTLVKSYEPYPPASESGYSVLDHDYEAADPASFV
jgi:diacylglycerol diphosphate phosphatase/phosphatidate phosphatase